MSKNEEKQLNNILLSFKKAMTDSFFRDAKQLGFSPSNFEILIYLSRNGPATMKNIASWLSITPPSASSLVDKLVAKKFIIRISSDKDRRMIRVALGKEAHKLFNELRKKKLVLFEKMLKRLNKKDKEDLVRILNKCLS